MGLYVRPFGPTRLKHVFHPLWILCGEIDSLAGILLQIKQSRLLTLRTSLLDRHDSPPERASSAP